MSFKKEDNGKIQPSLITPEFITEMSRILTNGAKKYGVENWKLCKDKRRYLDALERHLLDYKSGNLKDDDGNSNLAAIGINAMFLYWFDNEKVL